MKEKISAIAKIDTLTTSYQNADVIGATDALRFGESDAGIDVRRFGYMGVHAVFTHGDSAVSSGAIFKIQVMATESDPWRDYAEVTTDDPAVQGSVKQYACDALAAVGTTTLFVAFDIGGVSGIRFMAKESASQAAGKEGSITIYVGLEER